MPKALDMLRKVQRGELPPPPVATLIGFTIGSIEPGRVVMEMEAGPQHSSPLGQCTAASSAIWPTRPWGWPTRLP